MNRPSESSAASSLYKLTCSGRARGPVRDEAPQQLACTDAAAAQNLPASKSASSAKHVGKVDGRGSDESSGPEAAAPLAAAAKF